jgi:N-acetylneuraminic acid mutarotase
MKHPRERHGSACVDDSIFVVGGLMAGKQKKKPAVLSAVERFHPKFQRWVEVKPLPRRCYSPGVANYKNKVI